MRYEDIPDDLGDPGVGTEFKGAFKEYLSQTRPNAKPEDEWDWLWEEFDRSEGDISDIELARKIIDWFIDFVNDEMDDG